MSVTALHLDSVNVSFDSTRIINNVSLEVPTGQALGILGPNGSGKSTLVRASLGIHPSQGTITILGEKLRGRRVPWDRIGYAPQRVSATAGVPATALEVVMSGLLAGWRFRPGKEAKSKAMEMLDMVGLAHRADESVQTFSGGQQQRVLIARSLIKDPDILFLDEPFSGVDKDSREAITAVLDQQHKNGLTLVVVLHELQELASIIDTTIVIEHGRIVHHGPPLSPHPDHDHPSHDHDHEHGDDPLPWRTPMDEGMI